jgi:hypothetical protein
VSLVYRLSFTAVVGVIIFAGLAVLVPRAYSVETLGTQTIVSGSQLDHRLNVERQLGLEEAQSGSLGRVLLGLPLYVGGPLQTIFVILNPYPPWSAFYGRDDMFPLKTFVSAVSAFAWFALLPLVAVGLISCLQERPKMTVWVWGTVLVLALGLGFTMSNHVRWRLALMPFMAIVIGQGVVSWKTHRLAGSLTITCLLGGLVAYTFLKSLL